jgi:hypothetical protein
MQDKTTQGSTTQHNATQHNAREKARQQNITQLNTTQHNRQKDLFSLSDVVPPPPPVDEEECLSFFDLEGDTSIPTDETKAITKTGQNQKSVSTRQ